MEQLELHAQPRQVVGKKVKALRRKGFVPGILYGHQVGSLPLLFNHREIESAVKQTSSSTLIELHVEGQEEPFTAVFRDMQRDILKHNVTHVDLLALDLTETVRVQIPLVFTGSAPAVQEQGGVLLQILNEIEVEALPMALVPSIEIDISGVTDIGETITVGDLDLAEGITVLTSPTEVIMQVTTITEEPEEEELEAALEEPGEVEVITEAKEEGEEEMEEMEE